MASDKGGLKPSSEAQPPLLASKLPITTRASYFLQLWGLKIATSLSFAIIRLVRPSPPEIQPTLTKVYACRPRIQNRIFIPKSHKTGELLPLILDAHAGGFTLLDAEFDDEFCSTFANKFNIVIVSIDYSTAPSSKFPGPTNDIVEIVQAVIEDGTLPIDKSRVVLNGFSAGGNLCLSAAQKPELKDKIKGVVSWYPVADFTLTPAEKQSSRPYRNAKDTDDLKNWGPVWDWGYISPGQDIRDPLLSVRFARRENLPSWVYIIGAEYDMLANETRQMIFDIANLDKLEREDSECSFEKDTYKWILVKDVRHGFTHDLMDHRGPEAEAMRKKKTDEMVEEVGGWLFRGPFAQA